MRGVVVVPEIDMPARTAPWKYADASIVADCPILE